MKKESNSFNYGEDFKDIVNSEQLLIIQDLDGVCIPLVKDPLQRKIDSNYVQAVSKLKEEFYVLTCGEHEGRRGVNRLIEKSLGSIGEKLVKGKYLPGLAACGIEYQDRFGNISILGLKNSEKKFLRDIPEKMKDLLLEEMKIKFPRENINYLMDLVEVAVCDTRFTPTLNLNEILNLANGKLDLQRDLQSMMMKIMKNLLDLTKNTELEDSFYLHMMPNIGIKNNQEIMKISQIDDYGTTDIQFIIKGAIKEAGLLVLINKYIKNKHGIAPFGSDFNVRNAPKTQADLIDLCKERIPKNIMPLIVGVGDTVTSDWSKTEQKWLRGGSDRGFLSLIQILGETFEKRNKIVFVNSSNDEVKRPVISDESMIGISDKEDTLKFDFLMKKGPTEYIDWFIKLANMRSLKMHDS